jgi:hypothetical protein
LGVTGEPIEIWMRRRLLLDLARRQLIGAQPVRTAASSAASTTPRRTSPARVVASHWNFGHQGTSFARR